MERYCNDQNQFEIEVMGISLCSPFPRHIGKSEYSPGVPRDIYKQ